VWGTSKKTALNRHLLGAIVTTGAGAPKAERPTDVPTRGALTERGPFGDGGAPKKSGERKGGHTGRGGSRHHSGKRSARQGG